MSDELTELPNSWKWIKLGDIALPSDKKVEPTEIQSIPYIGLEHIEKNTGNLLGYGNSKDVKSTKSKFYSGDLLYGKLRPYLNKVHVVNFEGVCSTDILVFSNYPYIYNEFLKYRFLNKDFVSYASQNVNGVQHPRVNFPTLADFSLALPPLNEQKRIVAKIEELNDRTQKTKEALDSIPQLCDRFRQSVLAAAFRGDLTADWREQNPDVEPASVVLERIRKERRQNWEEEEITKFQRSGRQPKDDRWKEKYKEIAIPQLSELPPLVESWDYSYIETLLSIKRAGLKTGPFGSLLKKHEHRNTGIPVLGIENISQTGFVEGNKIYIDEVKAQELIDYEVHGGDIIISRSGTVGEICVVPYGLGEARISTNLIRVCLEQKVILSDYFCFLFRGSQFLLDQISELCSGSTRDFLNQSILSSLIFPIPPLNEQQEIIFRIQSIFKIIENIEKQYQQAKGKLDHLNQSILAKAFRGELVPQDPDDEPASVLLERIRAEREKLNNSKPKSDNSSKRKRKTVEGQGVLPGFE
ncbi:restriction endonuclease subunit S [Nostoc spongiaeforme FACHB-130]|uniref:Restriction endonuclease subunit S n=1 Tax=Nostoc spongiaeforme FACHB-130 TaxID=1357510 RepID=A0ABR8FZZ7_9NOSO|nr:restriction endonuclease subunit S [Nostoc spongiaeforme]MBD2596532.1 restriction endonuclease subunit S [Nostoc spongiaeforme FACHB-130]